MELSMQTYDEWKVCITSGGDIRTADAVRGRIEILSDAKHEETKQFVKVHGKEHLQQILSWLARLEKEL